MMTKLHSAHSIIVALALTAALLLALPSTVPIQAAPSAPAKGPLRVHPSNPLWLDDGTGKAVLLTGSHTWWNLSDMWTSNPPKQFNFDQYLSFLQSHNHNFIRLWRYEMPKFQFANEGVSFVEPHPWPRTGPGTANDGKPKFNLNKFNGQYFNRLKSRVKAAGDRGIYVGVMLFEGHALVETQQGWQFHPLNPENNINGIGTDSAEQSHTNDIGQVLKVQRKYVRKVLNTLKNMDNVIYEISNEGPQASQQWQEGMVKFIQNRQKKMPKKHLVILSTLHGSKSDHLWNSKAQIVAPGGYSEGGVSPYQVDPPANDGQKVVMLDTDHIWGCGGDSQWVFKSFLRGYHPIYMDSYYNNNPYCPAPDKQLRRNMGYALSYANRVKLAEMTPHDNLASSGYCLAKTGSEYLVYVPDGGSVTVNLGGGNYKVEWFNPSKNKKKMSPNVQGGGYVTLHSPFPGDVLLYLKKS